MRVPKARALILEVDKDFIQGWLNQLTAEYPIITETINAAKFMEDQSIDLDNFDIILFDAEHNDLDIGLQTLEHINEMDPDIETIIVGQQKGLVATLQRHPGEYRMINHSLDLNELAMSICQAAKQRKKLQMMRRLTEVSTLINSSTNISEILQRTCQIAVRLFNVDHSGIVEFDAEQKYGWTIAEYPENQVIKTVGNKIRVTGATAEEDLVLHGKYIHIDKISSAVGLGENKAILEGDDIQSILIVPIKVNDRVIASLSLDAINEPRTFTANEIDLCTVLASQAAIAIRNTRAINEAQQGYQSLKILFNSSKALLSPQPPEIVFRSVINKTHQELKTYHCQVWILGDKGEVIDLIQDETPYENEESKRIRENGVTQWVHREGKPIYVQDTRLWEDIRLNPNMLKDGVRACACLPLRFKDRRLGVVWLHYQKPHEFSKLQRDFLQLFTQYFAMTFSYASNMRKFIQSITNAMAAADKPKELKRIIVDGAKDILNANSTVLWPYDASQEAFSPEELIASDLPDGWENGFTPWKNQIDKIARNILKHGYLEIIDLSKKNIEFLDNGLRDHLLKIGICTMQAVRLEAFGEYCGVLFINYNRPIELDSENRAMAEEFSNYAALMLKMTQNFDWSLRAAKKHRMITQISIEGNLDSTLEAIVQETRELIHCNAATLYAHNPVLDRFFNYKSNGLIDIANMATLEQLHDTSAPIIIKTQEIPWIAAENAREHPILGGEFVRKERIVSSAGMRLVYKGQLVGVMFIGYREKHLITEPERINLEQFGNSAAIAIYAHITENESHDVAIKALHETGEAIHAHFENSNVSLQKILDLICANALKIVGGEHQDGQCFSHIVQTDGKRYWFIAASGEDILSQLKSKLGTVQLDGTAPIGIVGRTIKQNCSQLVNEPSKDLDYICIEKDIKSQLSIPLNHGKRVLGVLSIEHKDRYVFTAKEQHNLELLAVMGSYSLVNNRRIMILKGLLQAGKSLIEQEGTSSRQKTIATVAREEFNCDFATIYTYDSQAREICYPFIEDGYLSTTNEQAESERNSSSNLLSIDRLKEGNAVRKIIEKGEPVFADRSKDDPIFNQGDFIIRHSIISSAGIPLKIGDDLVGVMFINYQNIHNFTEQDRVEIELFAKYAAIAIETARQNKQLRENKGMIGGQTAIAWMSLLRKVWDTEIAKFGINAIASISRVEESLKDIDMQEQNRKAIEEELNKLKDNANKKFTVPVFPPEETGDKIDKIDLNTFIGKKFIGNYKRELDRRDLINYIPHFTQGHETVEVRVNEDWLYYSLRQLIENAILAVQNSTTKKILITLKKKDRRRAIIQIEDSGPGIAEPIKSKLFNKRIEPQPGWDGLGIGLLTVKAVLEAYHAEIKLVTEQTDERSLEGACFQIAFPLA